MAELQVSLALSAPIHYVSCPSLVLVAHLTNLLIVPFRNPLKNRVWSIGWGGSVHCEMLQTSQLEACLHSIASFPAFHHCQVFDCLPYAKMEWEGQRDLVTSGNVMQ